MRIRTDFVTNSSSSSFILAMKNGLTEKQEEALLDYIRTTFLGHVIAETEEELEDIEETLYYNDRKKAASEAIKNGMKIYEGHVSFESTEYDLCEMYQDIWNILEENGDGNFEVIEGSLDY